MGLDQPFGHDQQSEDLRPLGNDIAHHLSPLGAGIRSLKQQNPTDARDHKKDAERVILQELSDGLQISVWRFAALGRADLVHKLRGEDSHYQSRPIGDRIPEECSPVGVLVRVGIEHDPGDQGDARDDAE